MTSSKADSPRSTEAAAAPGRPLVLRVFVSSPGDVAQERTDALAVLRDLAHEPWVGGRAVLQPVMWDDPNAPAPMDAALTPQAAVNVDKGTPAECDLTIVILWSRIGSPPALWREDGSRFASGTEWEFENALGAGRPVWVYRRTDKPQIDIDDPAADERRLQYRAVQAFFERFKAPDGTLTGSYSPYEGAGGFAPLLRKQLTRFISELLSGAVPGGAVPEAPPRVPWLVPEAPVDHAVVGRDDVVARIRKELAAGESCCIVLVPGIGKSTLARAVVADREWVLAHSDGVLWADVGSRPDKAQQLRGWAAALGVPGERVAAADGLEELEALVRDAIGDQRLLLVLDDVWSVEAGREFMRLGQRCVSLVTTRSREIASHLVRQENTTELAALAEADALLLLDDIAPNALRADMEAARALVAAVQGLPLSVVLMGKYLKRESGDCDPDRVREAFRRLSAGGEGLKLTDDRSRTVEQIIDVSFAALRSEEARRALESLSIFRPKPHAFSKAMARDICGVTSEAVYELRDVGLLEYHAGGDYTMHRIVCDYARGRLPRARRVQLHRKALAWYGHRLRHEVADDLRSYLGWYRYEHADWQALKDAWLHHLAASGDARASSLAFLRVYFDAFWWWGASQHFPFCERLIREWSMRDVGPAQRRALGWLEEFQHAYPVGFDQPAAPSRWLQVERVLADIARVARLEGDEARLDGEDAQQVRGFIDFFTAEAIRGGRGDPQRAIGLYSAAHDRFMAVGGAWEAAWVRFHIAQCLLDAGDFAGAAAEAERSQASVDAVPHAAGRDPELQANNHRLLGDARLATGDTEGAIAHYRKALCFAFMFQARPEPADTYTTAFFRDIGARVAAAVLRLHEGEPAAAGRLVDAIDEFWRPWWRLHEAPDAAARGHALAAGDGAALAAALMPALPDDEALRDGTALAADVGSVLDALLETAGLAKEAARPAAAA